MSKPIELTQSQIKAKVAGATMFLFPIKSYGFTQLEINEFKEVTCSNCGHIMYSSDNYICPNCEGSMCHNNSPIQKGDKDIFVQEYAYQTDIGKMYYNIRSEAGSYYIPKENGTLIVASQMTKEQSRYSFSECIDVRVVRIQDITIKDISKLMWEEDWIVGAIEYLYNQQMKEQNINRTYKDNDYVFLVEFS